MISRTFQLVQKQATASSAVRQATNQLAYSAPTRSYFRKHLYSISVKLFHILEVNSDLLLSEIIKRLETLYSSLRMSRQTPPVPLNPLTPRTKQRTFTRGRICESRDFKIPRILP